jgi:hypothetical protein
MKPGKAAGQASGRAGSSRAAHAAIPDSVRDTLSGLVAFVVPGPDVYSLAQGVSTTEPGGIDAGATSALIATLAQLKPSPPPLPSILAAMLEQTTQAIISPAARFARLSFTEKASVIAAVEGDPAQGPLLSTVQSLIAFLSYAEAGVFDPHTRTLTGTPVGWAISGYEGVADGRDELKGYWRGLRRTTG